MDLYKQGAGNEIYTEEFSDAFIDMTFTQAARSVQYRLLVGLVYLTTLSIIVPCLCEICDVNS